MNLQSRIELLIYQTLSEPHDINDLRACLGKILTVVRGEE